LRAKAPEDARKVSSRNDRVDVRVYGDWAVVLVTSSWHVEGRQVGNPYQATHVWGKQKGEWRLVAARTSEVKP
jgi:ketosteroid isomerase-like protein